MFRNSARSLQTTLRGKIVFLRQPRASDFRDYARLIESSKKAYGCLVPPLGSKEQFDEYVQRHRREEYFGFFICLIEDGRIVGNINLFNIIRRRLQNACVGYFVGAAWARRGFATEALQLMIRFAFEQVKLHRVEANIQPGNAPSIALVKSAGFTREGFSRRYVKIAGRWRDHERWALLVEDWRAQRE